MSVLLLRATTMTTTNSIAAARHCMIKSAASTRSIFARGNLKNLRPKVVSLGLESKFVPVAPSVTSGLRKRDFHDRKKAIFNPILQPLCAVAAPPSVSTNIREAPNQKTVEEFGFQQISEQFIDEYQANAILYKHKKTGAEVMSVLVEDENKVFGIVFRTPPTDSTGIPHILEHSVLCGSKKYPVKEPFVELLKGSLQTFLNAFTYPDRTCYPVASTNVQDFYNLVDVYLDAVFFPNCVRDEQTFQQEGWHYELEDPKDDITFKGVVFNEMKGVYSQPDSLLNRASQQALFPSNTYGVDSGGDPVVIPSLSFSRFQEFHSAFYHPSNARVWFYGDDDPTERLRILGAYLDQFESRPESPEASKVSPQPAFPAPRSLSLPYAAPAQEESEESEEAGEGGHMVSVNWVLSPTGPLPLEQDLAVQFMDYLMLGTPAAPLAKALLESELGEALVGGGLSDELLQPTFSIGLKGVSSKNVEAVEGLVLSTLQALERDGFSQDAVDAAVNTIEFSLRENNTGSFPRGLNLMLRSVNKWIYDLDPFTPLRFSSALASLKAQLSEPEGAKKVFLPLLSSLLLQNTHRVTVHLRPEPALQDSVEEEEKQTLAQVKAGLSQEQLQELIESTRTLRDRQERPDPPEALQCVPSLALKDIPVEVTTVPRLESSLLGSTVLRHELVTNDILYAEVALDLSGLPHTLVPLLPLFCQALTEMGTAEQDFVELTQRIGRETGGLSVYPLISSKRGSDLPVSYLVVRGKATSKQAEQLFELIRTLLMDVQLTDRARFKQFVAQSRQRLESRLRGGGHSMAALRLDAMDSLAGWASESMGGVSYLEQLKTLENAVEYEWDTVRSSLQAIRNHVLARRNAIVNLTGDQGALQAADQPLTALLQALPETADTDPSQAWTSSALSLRLPRQNEALVIPTQVNYVGKAGNLYSAGYKLHGSAYVICKSLGTSWLWDRVRVSGGAYGGFCDFDSHSGMFTYLSYRDPNLVKTLDNYDGTVQFLRDLDMDTDSLHKAIIGTIGDVDSYQLPDAKGYSSFMRYLLGTSDVERQARREQILSTTVKDFHEFADALEAVKREGTVVVVGSAGDVAQANKERDNFLNVLNVL